MGTGGGWVAVYPWHPNDPGREAPGPDVQAAPLAASWGSASSPPRWSRVAAASTRIPPQTWAGPSRSASSHAARNAPNTGSTRATIEVRVGPMERMPTRKRKTGMLAPATPAQRSGRQGRGIAQRECRHVARARGHDEGEEAGRRDAEHAERRLLRRDGPEAASAEEDIGRLHRRGQQRQAEAERVERGVAGGTAEDDHGHPRQGERERDRPRAGQALLADEHRGCRDDRRVREEADEREGDARALKRREDGEVEDEARAPREHERRERTGWESAPSDPVATPSVENRQERRQGKGPDGGAPERERERRQPRVIRGS